MNIIDSIASRAASPARCTAAGTTDTPPCCWQRPYRLHNASHDFSDELISLGTTDWLRLAEAWFKVAA